MARRRLVFLLLLCVLGPLASAGRAAAAPRFDNLPAPAPCYTAAIKALSKKGALYSQGGYLASDPIDPSTGQPYPRTGPNSFDCSGLVWWAYAQAGVSIGSTTYTQSNNGVQIPCTLNQLQGADTTCWAQGDLIFLQYTGGQHVAIYVGNGLFMDCYNSSTGCILHDVRQDTFYQSHFWQARRIVDGCGSSYPVPGAQQPAGQPASDTAIQLYTPPAWNTLPDLVGYVSFNLPTCESCGGSVALPKKQFEVDWSNWTLAPFVWLAGAIEDIVRTLLCWMLSIASTMACWLTSAINTMIAAINTGFRLLIFLWLSGKAAAIGISFYVIELLRSSIAGLDTFMAYVSAWLSTLLDIFMTVMGIAASFGTLLLELVGALLGLFGWIGGMAFDLIMSIMLALQDVQTPAPLADTHPIYEMTRGALDAINDSAYHWLMYLLYAMAYVGFISWLARFLSATPSEG